MSRINFLFVFLYTQCVFGQYISSISYPDSTSIVISDSVSKMADEININEMKEILGYLTSNTCAGRELGSVGIDSAARYISNKFDQYGIQKIGDNNSYLQHVGFNWVSWDKTEIKANDLEFKLLWDYVSIPTQNKNLSWHSNEILFLGYGIDDLKYSDYKLIDARNKVAIIYNGEPTRSNGISWISNTQFASEWSTNFQKKIDAATKHGVKILLVIDEKFKERVDAHRAQMITPIFLLDTDVTELGNAPNVSFLSSSMSAQLLAKSTKKVISQRNRINKRGKPSSFILPCNFSLDQEKNVRSVNGNNIMAYIEGTDKKDEVLIISAHYDHIGKKAEDVFNGADDNGSGTTSVIQIAKAFQQAKKKGLAPRRSVLCLLVTGEEKGLLGSNYYVNNPRLDLNKTIADINIDMVGRIDAKYMNQKPYVYVIGSDRLSSELHSINESMNQKYSHLIMDYTYNAVDDPNRYYFRSDHYNFAEKKVPAIFFFNGTHEDYHRTTDDVEKIQFPLLAQRAKHIFCLAWNLANREQRIVVDR